jgi:hypothetical protein
MKLPEMSVIDTHLPSNHKTRGYTIAQMLGWGKACAEAEREECATLCEERGMVKGGEVFAARIRARGENT